MGRLRPINDEELNASRRHQVTTSTLDFSLSVPGYPLGSRSKNEREEGIEKERKINNSKQSYIYLKLCGQQARVSGRVCFISKGLIEKRKEQEQKNLERGLNPSVGKARQEQDQKQQQQKKSNNNQTNHQNPRKIFKFYHHSTTKHKKLLKQNNIKSKRKKTKKKKKKKSRGLKKKKKKKKS